MHYLCFKGWFRYYYLYVDTKNYLADSLFYKREIPVRFLETYEAYNKDDDEYCIVYCYVSKKYKQRFEEALEELPNKMALYGHLGYDDYCKKFIDSIEEKEYDC